MAISPPDDASVLDRVRGYLESRPEVRLAVLFGSRARGQVGRRSDVDLLVALEPDDRARRGELEVEAARAAGRALDVVYRDEAPPLLRYEIARDGQVLVERAPGDWVRFKAKAMIDWWDWAPIARRMHRAAVARLRQEVAGGRP